MSEYKEKSQRLRELKKGLKTITFSKRTQGRDECIRVIAREINELEDWIRKEDRKAQRSLDQSNNRNVGNYEGLKDRAFREFKEALSDLKSEVDKLILGK